MVHLGKDVEMFLRQSEVMKRFERDLRQSLDLPLELERRGVFFRSDNEFEIYMTDTIEGLVIEPKNRQTNLV